MGIPVLPAPEFYAETARYMRSLDPSWLGDGLARAIARERTRLAEVLDPARDRAVLDCTCGLGRQAIPLAQLGWRVVGTDITEPSLRAAAEHAGREGIAIDWRRADVRAIGGLFPATFDAVVTCMALDNLLEDAGLAQAVRAMHDALRPGGCCYIRLRDVDHLLAVRPRYDVLKERQVPDGRVIHLEDWDFDNDPVAVNVWIFLHEDRRKSGYRWETTVFAYHRRALRKAELDRALRAAGFVEVTFLPQTSPWTPYEVLARKPD